MRKTLTLNQRGYRIGESHPRATVPNAVIDRMYALAFFEKLTPAQIARQLGYSRQYVARVLRGEQRGQVAVRWRRVE